MTKSKSKSNDKIKKRTTHQKFHEKKEIVIETETDERKGETDKVRRCSEKVYENNSNDYKNIYFEV